MPKLAIVVSHPIQYYAPLFKTLAQEIELKVFYSHNPSATEIGKDGFGKAFHWDIDLLDGYSYEFLENVSENPSVSDYNGCDTPGIGEALAKYGATHVVIFGWYLKSLRQALQYCKKEKLPVAARGDSQLNPLQALYKRIIKQIYYPYFLSQFDAFLYVGKRNKAYLQQYGVKERKLIFSPHAVNQVFWKGQRESKEQAFTFIWVGKFIPKKRPADVISAFLKIDEISEKVQLKMIGTGDLLEVCKSQASISKNIHFLGFKNQTELREEYLKADALILASNYDETWGLVVNEAFAAGLPAIVSTACGCSPDLILEGKTGFSYKFAEVDDLKTKMKLLLQEKDAHERQQHLNQINEQYSYQRNIASFQKFLENY
jgi:glycosyltransferase involved in cell wall biosynthesis